LKIVGRAKDMIIRGGENVYPKELEEYFMKHPNISDIQVIGVEDEAMGEEICAWVRFKEPEKTTIEDLVTYCKGQIAHFKIPRYFRIVSEFPMTVTGKVKKIEMRTVTNEIMKKANSDVVDTKKFTQKKK
jgi:fatty-acyl-CoA synthase